MKQKTTIILTVFLLFVVQITFAQTKTVSGTVSDDIEPLPGVSVLIKDTQQGTVTDLDGKFSLEVETGDVLQFNFIGMQPTERTVGVSNIIDVVMTEDSRALDEVVVTAFGITREKKSLGYATQGVETSEFTTTKTDNVANLLSGKAAGVSVRRTNNLGGSTGVIIRGNTSLSNTNQALYVVDGVPISNLSTNSRSQEQGSTGYDYGNGASDINPEDIESLNVLKGAAASALYGSRASNGVIIITTKKGRRGKGNALGVTLSSNVTYSTIDKSTYPGFQTEYGAGYGGNNYNFTKTDLDGDGVIDAFSNVNDDASHGPKFDPNLKLLQWDALYPELTDTYGKATPWVASENGPLTFFETPVSLANSVSIANGNENGSYRLSYTNFYQKGILPNSTLNKSTLTLSTTQTIRKKFIASGYASYVNQDVLGRNSTGYTDNLVGAMRQWGQTNLDYKKQEDAYFKTKKNITWNPNSPTDLTPIYWDNPYWSRYENYQNDERNRLIGNVSLRYLINDDLDVFGRASVDTYDEVQEERRAVGSVPAPFGIGEGADGSLNRPAQQSGYARRNVNFRELNYNLRVNYTKDFNNLNLVALVGGNSRRTFYNSVFAATNGGLSIPGIYSLQNSKKSLPLSKEREETVGVDAIFVNASLGFKDFIFLEGSFRVDRSSTLPEGNNVYNYYSTSLSYLFSEHINSSLIEFGKARVNFASVGNSASFDRIKDTYVVNPLFKDNFSTSVSGTKRNANLKPETTNSIEAGLEMNFLENRSLGFDLAYYQTNTVDQIVSVATSSATGYNFKVINSGEIENRGIEISAFTKFKLGADLKWIVNLNWSKNENKVISLAEGLDNIQLGRFQGGVTINARAGEAYGTIAGTDYVYHEGKKVVRSDGRYERAVDQALGNVNPDWLGGVRNTLTYKGFALSFFIDVKYGGDIYSLDQYYGQATGVLATSVYTNDLGNPVRNTIENGGGFIVPGIQVERNEAGDIISSSPNIQRVGASAFGNLGYRNYPQREFVYDASYVKLREVSLSYSLPKSFVSKLNIQNATLSFVGSNLWIMYKNLPYADPETGLGGARNVQGFSTGALPSTRDFSFNLKLQF